MSPFFRGNVRPPRKHPRPWSLNPRLNPNIAKDEENGHHAIVALRASIYGIGINKENITLPVHNGVYNYNITGRDLAIGKGDVAAAPVPTAVVAEVEEEEESAETETVVKKSRDSATIINDDIPSVEESSGIESGTIPAENNPGLKTAAPREEEQRVGQEPPSSVSAAVETVNHEALKNDSQAQPENAVDTVETNPEEELTREIANEEENQDGQATAIAAVSATETAEDETIPEPSTEDMEAVSTVTAAETEAVSPAESSETAQDAESPFETKAEAAVPLKDEVVETMAPQEVEPSSVVEVPPFGANESKTVETEPSTIEEPVVASQASFIEASNNTSVGRDLATPPPETHSEPAHEESDDEDAAEPPFVPDHRHTPPSSRKASAGEVEAVAVGHEAHKDESPSEAEAKTAKGLKTSVGDAALRASAAEGLGVANPEPLMSDEQLDVSDEFRPGVKIFSDADRVPVPGQS